MFVFKMCFNPVCVGVGILAIVNITRVIIVNDIAALVIWSSL